MISAVPDSDEVCMLALQQGEDLALNRLMTRWEKPLRAFLYRSTQNEHDALDLAQETFVRIYQHRARYRAGARFSTWMFQIALNLARDHARRRVRRPTTALDDAPEPATAQTPEADALSREATVAVRAALAQLPEDQREIVLLSEFEELSHAEIAEIVGTTAKGVETRLYRAKEKLRGLLARYLRGA